MIGNLSGFIAFLEAALGLAYAATLLINLYIIPLRPLNLGYCTVYLVVSSVLFIKLQLLHISNH